ncbi:MAG TPA: SDR family NAD(P)-dependent oxidoreductase [Mycobacterium sp.]|nr:SDR family NAD(P)-dependent oxidoreductase [Mycobacterium sp.]
MTSTVTTGDGVTLAVHGYTEIDRRRPTILAVHGYPDNHHVWDGVAEQLAAKYPGRYNVVAYDVRGAGESSAPVARSGYRFPRLLADIDAVIGHLGADRVHLLAHDWGSIQSCVAVTDTALIPKFASYTSISGPHPDYAARFLRSARTPRAMAKVAQQWLAFGYIFLFVTPRLPEALLSSGLSAKVAHAIDRIGRTSTLAQPRWVPRSDRDYRNGLSLYRANVPAHLFSPPAQLPHTSVPVQVLMPRKDFFVTSALQRFTAGISADSRVVPIEGGHWVLTYRPDVIARLTSEWVDRVEAGTTPAGDPVMRTGPREVGGKLALVTGAGAGIGRATAVELARQGARAVVVVDRDPAAAKETAAAVEAAGADAAVYQVDVADEAAVNELAAQVNTEHGVVDILVNNAGGVIPGSRAFAAQMVQRGEAGTIINVSSAKTAVLAFSESLRADLAGDGITVTAVCPGRRRDYSPEATAKAIVKAVHTGRRR